MTVDRADRGVTLAELLVAATLLVGVTLAAWGQFVALRRVVREAERQLAGQQLLRAGLGAIVDELALAGLAVDPGGMHAAGDEALEAACATAIVFRADLDAGTAQATVPERALSGGARAEVTTGNDEIVAFVLGREDGTAPDRLIFDADVVGVPRDGRPERVEVPRVALSTTEPPYTLYRVTVRPDSVGSERTPVVDGIAALQFEYEDADGRRLDPPCGADGAEAARRRASIRTIRVSLRAWSDGEPSELSTALAPRNLGLVAPREP